MDSECTISTQSWFCVSKEPLHNLLLVFVQSVRASVERTQAWRIQVQEFLNSTYSTALVPHLIIRDGFQGPI